MKRYIIYTITILLLFSCNLDESLVQDQEANQIPDTEKTLGNLSAAKGVFQTMQDTGGMLMLQEHPSDEMAGPTRGADWFDGGEWQQLHLMTWTANHSKIRNAWEQILGGLYYSTEALSYNPTPEQAALATYYKSFFTFLGTDFFGKVPYRIPGESFSLLPEVHPRELAIDFAIQELEAVYENLPATSNPSNPNMYNGAALLAKMYLNKAVYHATAQDGTPMTTFNFDNADMQKVITYCDIVINGPFSLQADYFDNFAPDNTDVSTEAIFSAPNSHAATNELRQNYFMTLHYNQNPNGWNGFVALTDLYNKFNASDPRLSQTVPGLTDVSGLKAGILLGQQVNQNNQPINDRLGNPLAFTQNFSLSNSSEEKGMRVVKYLPDYVDLNAAANDWIILRLADVILMKAEAMERMGQSGEALLTQLWTARGTTGVYTYNGLETILDERARELYWEGWRRQDQIRFGTFLNPVQERSTTPDASKLIFPIPVDAIGVNPNLSQNPGY